MNIKRPSTILALSVLLFCIPGKDSEGNDAGRRNGKPNVLFIAIDDLNDWNGMLKGNSQARTPHHGQVGCQRDVVYQCALRGSGLRSFKVRPDERDPPVDIGQL